MGIATNAIMAFGFDLGDELPESLAPDGGDCFDFEEWFKALHFDRQQPTHRNWDVDWPEYRAAHREALAAFPFDLIAHCSCDCPSYFLAARGTEVTARRGYPVPAVMAEVQEYQIQAMREFCEKYEIEWKEPQWHIFSMWC